MCNCVKNKQELSISVRKAKAAEKKENKPYGVFFIVNQKTGKQNLFVAELSKIKSIECVCCYYNSKGIKVDFEKKEVKKPKAKNDKPVQKSKA